MKVKKAIKRIVALGIGATMMGATLLGATAAGDLANYPSNLVKNGVLDAVLIAGGNAADNLAVVDIATNMYYGAATGATTVTVAGDAKQIKETTDYMEYEEDIEGVMDVLTDDDLTALEGGQIVNDKGTFDYNQYLDFASTNIKVEFTTDPDDDDDVAANYLHIPDATQTYVYKMEFPTALESDITGTSDELDDLEDEQLNIMGTVYEVVDATSTAGDVSLDLMGGALRVTQMLDETKDYTVNGVPYTVSLDFIDADECAFTVNGESTKKIMDGGTEKLEDQTEIGVSEIYYQDFAGGVMKCEFYLGAQKLTLRDGNCTDTNYGGYEVEFGEDDVDDTDVYMTCTDDGSTFKLSDLRVKWTADDDYYVAKDGKLSSLAPDGALFGNWDLEFKGANYGSVEKINLKRNGDTKMTLTFTNKAGETIDLPAFYASGPAASQLGEEATKELIVLEVEDGNVSYMISKDDYFVVTSAKSTYALQYRGSEDSDNTLDFKNLGTGESFSISYTTVSGADTNLSNNAAADATLILGGKSFNVFVEQDADDSDISVDLNDDGDMADTAVPPTIYTKNGHMILLDETGEDDFILNIDTDAVDDFLTNDDSLTINVTVSGTEFQDPIIEAYENSGTLTETSVLIDEKADVDNQVGYTLFGTKVMRNERDDSADDILLEVPESQAEMLVFITSGATTSAVTGGDLARVTIPVTATKLPDEVSDLKAQNIISVGGPCANSATAKIMYNEQGLSQPADCAQDFTPGEAMIKLYDVGTKMALIIAGYSADDTRRAGKVLAQYRTYALSGEEVKVTGTTFTDMQVTKVA